MKRFLAFLILGWISLNSINGLFFVSHAGTTSVYADDAEQEKVYSILQKEWDFSAAMKVDNLSILKESITPVYFADLSDIKEIGQLVFSRHSSKYKGVRADSNHYVAKVVTEDDRFAGNIEFYIYDEQAHQATFTPTPVLTRYFADSDFGGNAYLTSFSYADHAKRIQDLLSLQSFLPGESVKFVRIEGIGNTFCINIGDEIGIVYLGYSYPVSSQSGESKDKFFYIEDLLPLAESYCEKVQQYEKRKAEWESEHPGEMYFEFGEDYSKQDLCVCGPTENIIHIREYLSQNTSTAMSETTRQETEETITKQETEELIVNSVPSQSNHSPLLIVVGVMVAIVGTVVVIVIISTHRRRVNS